MSKLKIFWVLLLGFALGFDNLFGQNTYTVTSTSLGLGLNVSLDDNINQAIIDANAGNTVTVLFDAPGPVQINTPLPVLDNSSGTIIFTKNTSNASPQGIQFAGTSQSGINYGIVINNTTVGSFINIDGLVIQGFNGAFFSNGIYCALSAGCIIQNCSFDTNINGITVLNSDGLSVSNNQFTNTRIGVRLDNTVANPTTYNCNINGNIFTGALITNNRAVELNNSYSGIDPVNWIVTLNNNQITSYADGIIVTNLASALDNSFVFNVSNCSINSRRFNIRYTNPTHAFILQNSVLSISNPIPLSSTANLIISSDDPRYGLDLVQSNSLGYTTVNIGNTFNQASANGYSIICGNDIDNKFIGLNLPAPVLFVLGYHSTIRECKINASTNIDHPINLSGTLSNGNPNGNFFYTDGNALIPKPIINSVSLSGNLAVQYQLDPNLSNMNAEFYVDFYKADANGSLMDFIGSQTIQVLTNGTYTVNLSVPPGVNLQNGDRIASTLTSKGANASLKNELGTSEAVYATIGQSNNCCLNINPIVSATPTPSENERSGNSSAYFCNDQPLYLSIGSCNCDNSNSSDFTWNIAALHSDGSVVNSTQTGCTPSITANTGVVSYSITVTQTCGSGQVISPILSINMLDCTPKPCENCIPSFTPLVGKTYIIGAWVKDADYDADHTMTTFTDPQIVVDFQGAGSFGPFTASGLIIDGWQRVEQEFTVPAGATTMDIKLLSVAGDCFFDDIRVFPKDGSMKSYVYDPITLRLMAELDERNYATFYEYDEEGKLTRVKKETERGVMTIKEAKNSLIKK